MFHEEGASTDVTGTEDDSRAEMMVGNGSRISPEKLKPAHWIRLGSYEILMGNRAEERYQI